MNAERKEVRKMKKKTRNQLEPSRIQKAEGKMIRDFCGEVLWEVGIPSNQSPYYVFQLVKVSETSAIREDGERR